MCFTCMNSQFLELPCKVNTSSILILHKGETEAPRDLRHRAGYNQVRSQMEATGCKAWAKQHWLSQPRRKMSQEEWERLRKTIVINKLLQKNEETNQFEWKGVTGKPTEMEAKLLGVSLDSPASCASLPVTLKYHLDVKGYKVHTWSYIFKIPCWKPFHNPTMWNVKNELSAFCSSSSWPGASSPLWSDETLRKF